MDCLGPTDPLACPAARPTTQTSTELWPPEAALKELWHQKREVKTSLFITTEKRSLTHYPWNAKERT